MSDEQEYLLFSRRVIQSYPNAKSGVARLCWYLPVDFGEGKHGYGGALVGEGLPTTRTFFAGSERKKSKYEGAGSDILGSHVWWTGGDDASMMDASS